MTKEDWEIDISGLDKAGVLAALYNRAKPQGYGFLQFRPGDMTIEEARSIIEKECLSSMQYMYFDYLFGRVMKVCISRDALDPGLYDRDNGQGAAAEALSVLGR